MNKAAIDLLIELLNILTFSLLGRLRRRLGDREIAPGQTSKTDSGTVVGTDQAK